MFAPPADPITPSDAQIACSAAAASTARDTILVVEDESNIAGLLTCILERGNFHVISARSGREALEIFDDASPEIAAALLDATLPDMHGGELCRRLREQMKDVPVLVVSGRN